MANILLILAILGIIVGAYAVAMPTLTRRGLRLPFSGFFGDADEGEDEPFKPAFEMPRHSEAELAIAHVDAIVTAPAAVVEPLPAPLRPPDLDEEEDDPTLIPLFEGLVEEISPAVEASGDDAAEGINFDAPPQEPERHLTLVKPPSDEAILSENPGVLSFEGDPPAPEETPAAGGDDMLSLFAESADEGRKPNILREAVGDVSIADLQAEVRALREILDKHAA